MLFLLEDAVLHRLPDDRDEEALRSSLAYPDAVARATLWRRPPGGDVFLARIVDFDCDGGTLRRGMDRGWALPVLAEAYPERSLGHVDRLLASFRTEDRYFAVEAAGLLPRELARPRLLRGLADGGPEVSARARDLWTKLFVEAFPADELSAVAPILGGAAPSERLRARVLALRGPREARIKLLSVLLGEAPEREALAALAVALADDRLILDAGSRHVRHAQADVLRIRCRRLIDDQVTGTVRGDARQLVQAGLEIDGDVEMRVANSPVALDHTVM